MDFSGKHILVTGGSSGIGLVTARRLHRAGATITLVARRSELLEQAKRDLGTDRVAWAAADLGEKDQLEAAFDAAVHQNGSIHGLFANAALTGGFTPLPMFSADEFERTLRVNLTSVFWAIQKVIPAMMAAGEGSIVTVGSMASKRGMAMNPAYVASKHGLLGLTRAVAVELAPHGVRANCVIPGFIVTDALERIPDEQKGMIEKRVPQRRMGSPEELAEVAAFLLSDLSRHVTGQDWAVDGGVLNTLEVG